MRSENSQKISFEETLIIYWWNDANTKPGPHDIPLCVSVFHLVFFESFGDIILSDSNKTIPDYVALQCAISLAGQGQKLRISIQTKIEDRVFWTKFDFLMWTCHDEWQFAIQSVQRLFYVDRKGSRQPKKSLKQLVKDIDTNMDMVVDFILFPLNNFIFPSMVKVFFSRKQRAMFFQGLF